MKQRLLVFGCVLASAFAARAETRPARVMNPANAAIHQASALRGPASEELQAWLCTAPAEAPATLLVLAPGQAPPPSRGAPRLALEDNGAQAVPGAPPPAGPRAEPGGISRELPVLLQSLLRGPGAAPLQSLHNAWTVQTTAAGARRLIEAFPEGRIGLWGRREDQLKLVKPALGVEKAWGRMGKGTGVLVAMVETGAVDQRADAVIPHLSRMSCPGETWHATLVGGVVGLRPYLKSTLPYRGLAPRAALLDAGACSHFDTDLFAAIEWALGHGARILNLSWGAQTYGTYDAMALAADELIYQTGSLWVAAAGNDAGFVMSPALAHSVMGVGATDLRSTLDRADDRVASFSSYLDPGAGYSKPEIVAPGVDVISAAPGIQALARGTGSSLAAPSVTALAALAAARRPELGPHGETLRALLLAGAVDRTESLAVDGPGDREGQGQPRATLIAESAVRGRFGWMTMGPEDAGQSRLAARVSLRRGQTLRVALAWDQPGSYHAAGLASMADFDLALTGPEGAEAAASRRREGAYEILEYRAGRGGKYTVTVDLVRHDTVDRKGEFPWPTPAGFAWTVF